MTKRSPTAPADNQEPSPDPFSGSESAGNILDSPLVDDSMEHQERAGAQRRAEAERTVQDFEKDMLPHLDTLYATAIRLTRKESDAQDLVQDAVLRAYRFYDRFEPGTNPKAWLTRILTNTFINRYRRKTLERDVTEGVHATAVGDGVMSRAAMRGLSDPVDTAHRGVILREIEEALSLLPEDYRVVIVLADIEELSYREIADAISCPIGTVMSRLFRARRQLQSHLLQHARDAGFIPEDPVSEANVSQPIQLESYRRKRAAK